ncbi:MAG: oligosaccharide flippase family protein [Bacteroidales bacterium]|nr:oligosaccharide flippase family protein [Bacteroidales bacterium]
MSIKSLVKETAVYGISSIAGRFLNWLLVPLYTYVFPTAQYGVVSYLYAMVAVALVILTYGMETGFFRYANDSEYDSERVYTTSMISVASTSLLFIVLLSVFLSPVAGLVLLPNHPSFVWMMGVTVALDAFCNIPFAYLRFKSKAWRFAGIKLLNVMCNILLNLFFLLACPIIQKHSPAAIDWFYSPLGGETFGIGWIFVSNLLSTLIVALCLIPYIGGRKWSFDGRLLKKMLSYSWPLLILGVAGILSQNMGQLVIPYLFRGQEEVARDMVGIYGANIKIAIVMVMFTQAFRYAYEPFIFSQARARGEERQQAYCDAMKYFIIFGLFIFLAVMFFLPVIRYFERDIYWPGLKVVPVMMIADLFFGIFFNLSLWYKLTDRTRWGMYFSLLCFVLMAVLNVVLVTAIGAPDGYMGSAYAALISYGVVMIVCYFAGRYYYPLPYDLKSILTYTIYAAFLYAVARIAESDNMMLTYGLRVCLLLLYVIPVGLEVRRRHHR